MPIAASPIHQAVVEIAPTVSDRSRLLGSDVAERAASVLGDGAEAVDLAAWVGVRVPAPGSGSTAERWSLLATLGAIDLTAARVTEAHLDALAILSEAALEPGDVGADPDSTWGVFAAEGPGVRVDAAPSGSGAWKLNGTKPWCSLAGRLSHALVTAHTEGGRRRLFAVNLRGRGVSVTDKGWHSRGLAAVPSGPIDLTDVDAVPVGEDDWYLRRSGFAWGGAGVAACWYGGSVGIARLLWERCVDRVPDQIAQMHLGAIDLALHTSRLALRDASVLIDAGSAQGLAGAVIAARTRGIVVSAAETIITRVGHALGPAPLTQNEEHARRVADLEIYIRQFHAERDEAALGRDLLAGPRPW
jgi:alkylation response protein AidB-like acyl-CoA dehydrogenase